MPIDRTAPPRRPTPRASSTARQQTETPGVSASFARRKEGAEGVGQAATLILLIRQQYADAQAVGMHTPAIATELARVAEGNETIGKWLDYFSVTGPYSGLVKASLPLVLQLMANHNIIKPEAAGALGVVAPKTLELAGKAEQEKIEAAILLQIQESQRETSRIKADILAQQNGAPSAS